MSAAPIVAGAAEWARRVPAHELDATLCEAHVAHEVAADLKQRATLFSSGGKDEAQRLFNALGARLVPGRLGDPPPPPPPPRPPGSPLRTVGFLIGLLVMLAPIIGIAGFLTGADAAGADGAGFTTKELQPGTKLELATVAYWVSAAIPLGVLFGRLKGSRLRDPMHLGVLVYVVIGCALILVALTSRGFRITAPFTSVTWPVWTAGTLELLALAVLLTCSRAPTEGQLRRRIVLESSPNQEQVTQHFTALPAPARSQLLAVRREAVEILQQRGLAAHDSAVATTPFGELSWTRPHPAR